MPLALILDHDTEEMRSLEKFVRDRGFDVTTAPSVADARASLEQAPDLAFLAIDLPDGSGLDLARDLDHTATDVVIVSGGPDATLDSAVDALRAGVVDFLRKPIDMNRVSSIAAATSDRCRMRREIADLRGRLRRLGHFGRLVGTSRPMQELYDVLAKVAPTDASVLITGETGVGKEVVAGTIHDLSPRKDAPFVPLNCGAIPKELIGSELFGHEKGAFTGAGRRHKGCFEQADGGTLFLDEIAEMPPDLQVNLLRVLETSTIRRVGGEDDLEVDVRVIAATNREPRAAVERGDLREDLLYRLAVFPMHVPPLRERIEDIKPLARHFLDQLRSEVGVHARSFSPAALARLESHAWPGNVRELANVVRRSAILANGDRIEAADVPLEIENATPETDGRTVRVEVGTSIAEAEKALILATLDAMDGNKKRAADVLGISVKTLYTRLNRYQAAQQ